MSWFLRRRRRRVAPLLVADLVPRAASSRQWVKACRAEATPRASLEGGLAELALVRSVVEDAADAETHRAVAPAIEQAFQTEFAATAAQSGLNAVQLEQTIAERLVGYVAVLDRAAPDWHLRFAARVYANVAGEPGDAAAWAPVGTLALVVAGTTRQFVKDALG